MIKQKKNKCTAEKEARKTSKKVELFTQIKKIKY